MGEPSLDAACGQHTVMPFIMLKFGEQLHTMQELVV
jgi:hypothetical protein